MMFPALGYLGPESFGDDVRDKIRNIIGFLTKNEYKQFQIEYVEDIIPVYVKQKSNYRFIYGLMDDIDTNIITKYRVKNEDIKKNFEKIIGYDTEKEYISLKFTIKNKTYEEVLEMWNDINDIFNNEQYQKLTYLHVEFDTED